MDRDKIEQGVRLILEGIGEDPAREGLARTPERVAEHVRGDLRGPRRRTPPSTSA